MEELKIKAPGSAMWDAASLGKSCCGLIRVTDAFTRRVHSMSGRAAENTMSSVGSGGASG